MDDECEHQWEGKRYPSTPHDPGEFVVSCRLCGMEKPGSGEYPAVGGGEFTPGPWRPHHKGATRVIAPVPDSPDDVHTICNCWSSPLSPPRAEAVANARLIAAAPDLLAACELVLATLRSAIAKAHGDAP